MLTPAPALFVCSQLRWTAGIPALHSRLVTLCDCRLATPPLHQAPRGSAPPPHPLSHPRHAVILFPNPMIFYIHTDTKWTLSRVLTKTNQTIVTKLVWLLKSERASDQLDVNLLRHMTTRIVHIAVTLSDVYESGLVEPPRPALCHVPLVRPLFAIARSG